MDFLLLFDVVLAFFSAIETDTIVIVDHRTIAWKYLTGWFLVDLLASLPIALFLPDVGQNLRGVRLLRIPRMLKLLKILRLLRAARVLRASKYARTIQRFINLNPAILRLIIFILAFLLFAHVSASFWFLVAELEDFSPDTWVVRYGILDSDRETQYIASLYFAITLLSTVRASPVSIRTSFGWFGSFRARFRCIFTALSRLVPFIDARRAQTGLGDVVPLLQSEQIFTIFLELAGVTIISYMTSTITGLIGSFDARAQRRQNKFEEIERFMGAKTLSAGLRGSIRDYFELVLASKSTAALDEAKLLGELSGPLQTAVMFEVHGSLIKRFGFFRGKQPEFVRDVLMAATPMVVKHDRVLMREGMTGDALVLLIDGRVNLESSHGKVYMQLPPGSVFGAVSLLCTGRNVCDVRSVGTVHTYSVPRRDVERILEDYPDVESELLNLALARLRRMQMERQKMRSQSLATDVAGFSPLAEDATDAAVTRGLATTLVDAGAMGQLPLPLHGLEQGQSRRESAPAATAQELATSHSAGSAERIALLKQMTDRKQFRRPGNSQAGKRPGKVRGSSGHDSGIGPADLEPAGRSCQKGENAGALDDRRVDSKAVAAAHAHSAAEVSVTAAMKRASAPADWAETATGLDGASPGHRAPVLQAAHVAGNPGLQLADVTDVANGSGTARQSDAGTAVSLQPSRTQGCFSGASASPRARVGDGEEGGPWASPERALDARPRQERLVGDSRSGFAQRGPATPRSDRGSRRHSLATTQPFDRQPMSSKELELQDQTDSLIERTLTTAKRAVRRKERLVTRMATERERRQFTSRPMHAVLQSSSPHPDDQTGTRKIVSSPADPPALMTAGRVQSKSLQQRARGLRAKLTEQRRNLRAMTTLNSAPAVPLDPPQQAIAPGGAVAGDMADSATAATTPPPATPALPDTLHAAGQAPTPAPPGTASSLVAPLGVPGQLMLPPPEVPSSPSSSSHHGELDGLRLVTGSSSLLFSPGPRTPRRRDPATAFALDEMTVAMRGVASALMGLQHEQEAIVDLLIAVLADDDDSEAVGD